MSARIVAFTSLFPSLAFPNHGLFVQERLLRVAAATGFELEVVCPVPVVPAPVCFGDYRRFAAMPEQEDVGGIRVLHPRYFHLPGLSTRAHARRVARAALPVVRERTTGVRAVIDAHYVYPDGVAALTIARELGVPCFVTARGSDINVLGRQPSIAAQMRAAAGTAAGLFAVSAPLCERFAAIAGRPVELARNGVDLELFRPGDRAAARRSLGLPESAAVVATIGRLVAAKGFHLVARALHDLPASVHMVVVGDGPQRDELLALAPVGRCHLLGALPRERVAEVLRASDVVALPSEREGWPNVVTEALASGVPVVATPVGSVPSMLAAPHVGSLVRADAVAIARELERFLSMPRDPERIRAFASRFSWREPIEHLAARLRASLEPCATR